VVGREVSHLFLTQKVQPTVRASDVQRMAQQLLAAKRCIEVTMLSE
jgi:hypothetical protein